MSSERSSSPSSTYSSSSQSSLLLPTLSPQVSPPPKGYLDKNHFFFSSALCSSVSPASSPKWSSREPSETTSNDDDDGNSTGSVESDSTLDDEDSQLKFGYPLERIPRHDEILYEDIPRTGGFEIEPYYYDPDSSCQTFLTSRSHSSLSVGSSAVYDGIDYDELMETILLSPDNPFTDTYSGEYISITPPIVVVTHSPLPSPLSSRSPSPTSSSALPQVPKLMIKRISRDSQEYSLLLKLNQPDLRADPWNPAPHLRCAVERESMPGGMRFNARDERGWVFLCMEALRPYDKPPLEKVGMWVDFFRQVLEGLSFLHEHGITVRSLSRSSNYMVDLSSAPSSLRPKSPRAPLSPRSPGLRPYPPSRKPTLSSAFDRATYPVHYYLADFSQAEYHPPHSPVPFSPTTPKHKSKPKRSHTVDVDINNPQPPYDPFKRDVFELGKFFESALVEIPAIAPKLRSLITAMTISQFAADDARKLFEALCRSIDGQVFDMPVGRSQKDEGAGAAKLEQPRARDIDKGGGPGVPVRGERPLPARGQTISIPVGESGTSIER